MGKDGLYMGRALEGETPVCLDSDHLTTHAVCLGMTGSGKTGLGIVVLEELARRSVPLLVIDLKGDMVNLLLNFPTLDAGAFEPWLPSDTVAGRDRLQVAEEQAAQWRAGLERDGLGPDDVRAVGDGVEWRIVTPGVGSLAPLDILPALSAPDGWDLESDPDGAAERVNGVTSALLSLVGRGGDPLTDRDQVLLASIVLEHWRRRDILDLPRLLASIADPPLTSLGALPLDSFFPREERMKLVIELNTLLASPVFAAWTTGVPLDMHELLGGPGAARATIVSVAHLDARERLFILGLLASELVAWMRWQPAWSGLRALLYLDEVQGILPPHPFNPPPKGPLLTLLKQGRAFGVGAWLATQNPVDLDYRALGNAGVKVIGRLITDRDRSRALEGLGVRTMDDGRDAGEVVASLGNRQFLLDDVRAKQRTRTFSSRWAMSYLRGPVSLVEMTRLLQDRERVDSPQGQTVTGQASTAAAPRGTAPPVLSSDIDQRFDPTGHGEVEPQLVVAARVAVTRATLGLQRVEDEVWRIPVGSDGGLDWEAAERLDGEPETVGEPAPGTVFPTSVPGRLDRELAAVERGFVAWRARTPLTVLAHRDLKLIAEPGEGREAFLQRCLEAADRADDATQRGIRKRYESRMNTLQKRLERERDELERDQEQLRSRKAEEVLGVVEGLFSVLMGSRGLRSASGKAASRMKSAAGRRRMSQRATGAVEESVREIERIEHELEGLASELQEEIDRIAGESEERAARVEEVGVRPKRTDITVTDAALYWS